MKITGKVIHGDAYGRTIGFPTANIDAHEYMEQDSQLEYGVYGGFVDVGGNKYLAGIVIGPEDSEGIPRLEAHLIDFSDDLYGALITFHILKHVRPFEKYDSEDTLKKAIQNDIETIKKMNLCLPE